MSDPLPQISHVSSALSKLPCSSVSFPKAMYILVNKDLKMRPGKVASQVAHAACKVVRECEVAIHGGTSMHPHLMDYLAWVEKGETKIVLQADQETMQSFLSSPDAFPTYDHGETTQVPSWSLTAMAFLPCTTKDSRFESLKLYN